MMTARTQAYVSKVYGDSFNSINVLPVAFTKLLSVSCVGFQVIVHLDGQFKMQYGFKGAQFDFFKLLEILVWQESSHFSHNLG